MASNIERLRAAAAAAKKAPPAQPESAPAGENPAGQVAAAATGDTTTQNPPPAQLPATVAAPATGGTFAALPILVGSDEEAAAEMRALAEATTDSAVALGNTATEVGGSGLRYSHPFVQVKQKNWVGYDKNPPAIRPHLPLASLAYPCIYVGHRLGATLWPKGQADGSKPLGAFVVPNLDSTKDPEQQEYLAKIAHVVLGIASKVQFTNAKQRDLKFPSGKLTPSAEFLLWTPKTDFFLAVVPTFNGCDATLKDLKKLREDLKCPLFGKPFILRLINEQKANKNGSVENQNAFIPISRVALDPRPIDTTEVDMQKAIAEAFMAKGKEPGFPAALMNQRAVFNAGKDFKSDWTDDQLMERLVGLAAEAGVDF